LQLRLAHTLIELESAAKAGELLDRAAMEDPFEWRVAWYRGYSLLAQGDAAAAYTALDQVYNELPGELAVKLAVAMAAEAAGDDATASRLYDLVSTVDPNYVTAAFGLARCLARNGRRAEAVAAYQRVPASSLLYPRAQIGVARVLIDLHGGSASLDDLRGAAAAIDAMAAEGRDVVELRAELFESALPLLSGGDIPRQEAVRLLGQPLEEVSLRRGLEESLRGLARLEPDRQRQLALIDRANQSHSRPGHRRAASGADRRPRRPSNCCIPTPGSA
jgi:serine/threonine-protein kinase PknG